jgi:hypothetical protein
MGPKYKKTIDNQGLIVVILINYIGVLGISAEWLMGRIPDSNIL